MTAHDNVPPGGPVPGEAPPPPPSGRGFYDSIRRIGVTRSDDRWLGGVAAGVADRFGLDPLLVRGLLILSFFVAGAGLVLYAIAWALLPERSDGRIHLQEASRGTFDVAMLGAAVVLLIGLVWGGGFWPWWFGGMQWVSGLLWIAFWVLVVWMIVKLVRSRRPQPPVPPAPAQPFSPAPPAQYSPEPATSPSGPQPGEPSDVAEHRTEPYGSGPYASGPRATAAVPASGGVPPTAPLASGPYAPPGPAAPTGPPLPPGAAHAYAGPVPPPGGPAAVHAPPRRVGGATVAVVLGLVLLAGAALLAGNLILGTTLPVWAAWVGASVIIIGAGIVVGGLRGLRGGWLTFFAIGGIATALVTSLFVPQGTYWQDLPRVATSEERSVGSTSFTPGTLDSAREGVTVQLGEAFVDLTALDLDEVTPGDPVVVPIVVTGGHAEIIVPSDTAVEAVLLVTAAHVEWDVDGAANFVSGFSTDPTTYRTSEVDELEGAVLQLDVDARAGAITIKEQP